MTPMAILLGITIDGIPILIGYTLKKKVEYFMSQLEQN